MLFKNGDLAQRVETLVCSARRCCRGSRVRAPVRPGTFSATQISNVYYTEGRFICLCQVFQGCKHYSISFMTKTKSHRAKCTASICCHHMETGKSTKWYILTVFIFYQRKHARHTCRSRLLKIAGYVHNSKHLNSITSSYGEKFEIYWPPIFIQFRH
jgi:hypothetical protein